MSKFVTIKEATDKQIIDYIFDNPEEWEIVCFYEDDDYEYEIKRHKEGVDVYIFDVVYVEDEFCQQKDWCIGFPIDFGIEVEDEDE